MNSPDSPSEDPSPEERLKRLGIEPWEPRDAENDGQRQRAQFDDDDRQAHGGHKRSATKPRLLPPPSRPMPVGRAFVKNCCLSNNLLTLRYWRGAWWRWEVSHWIEVEDRAVRRSLYLFTEKALYSTDGGKTEQWSPNRHKISDLHDALSAICLLRNNRDQPSWLDDRTTGVIVSVRNGLLDVERRELLPHTPQFFNQTSVPFDYEPEASQPDRWLSFLKELWPKEADAINVLAEWFGYVISGRLDLHKIMLMVGPTRGGKGAIARVLGALIGRQNVAGPTLNSLAGEFGLAPLIGKPLAIVSDARFVGKNGSVVVERLLSISGEDTLTVNRKYRDQWTGKLPCRLHIISNELPRLGDASTAVVGRIVLLLLSSSWLGKEDHGLERALHTELTSILNWALAGLYRLTVENNNRFTRLSSADEAIIAMRDLASPVAAFVREKCQVGHDKEIKVDELYAAYRFWCDDNGHAKATKQTFGRDLRAALPRVSVKRPRELDTRFRSYIGICLNE